MTLVDLELQPGPTVMTGWIKYELEYKNIQ